MAGSYLLWLWLRRKPVSLSGKTTLKIPVITGPTASGKTGVAIELAKLLNGEIISADSMQVYRHLSIGTAKPTSAELQGIPYHLIDHVDPDEQYNLGRFVEEAQAVISAVKVRGKRPIICGGTGMYIRGLVYGIFSGGKAHPEIRRLLDERLESEGLPALYCELKQVDPVSAERYGENDRQRILRALEVYHGTGQPLSAFHNQDFSKPAFPTKVIILSHPRQVLYERINTRVDKMLEAGLLKEVRNYLAMGWCRDNPAVKALGYREVIESIEGSLPLETALEQMKQKSRNYAKRQETWFRSMQDAMRLECHQDTAAQVAEVIFRGLEKN